MKKIILTAIIVAGGWVGASAGISITIGVPVCPPRAIVVPQAPIACPPPAYVAPVCPPRYAAPCRGGCYHGHHRAGHYRYRPGYGWYSPGGSGHGHWR